MTHLTLSIDDALIRKAQARALREGTSVNARIREFLTAYAGDENRQQTAAQNFIATAQRSRANHQGATWSRAGAYDRVAE